MHKIECHVATLTRRTDHANEHHCLAAKALESSNKEKIDLRQLMGAQGKLRQRLLEKRRSKTSLTTSSSMTLLPITGLLGMPN